MAKNKVDLYLRISNFNDITHDQLTELIGIESIRKFIVGERRNPNNPNSSLVKCNSWLMGHGLDEYVSFDEQMNALLDIIELKIDVFRTLSQKYYLEFGCAIFTYYDNEESTPWIHLGERYNKLVREVNIEFDVDLYAWGNRD